MPITRRSPDQHPRRRLLQRIFDHPAAVLLRDFPLFLIGARTDAGIRRTQATSGPRVAFEEAYTRSSDPWASAARRYRYQRRKYEQIMAVLPDRRFRSALDLGCGLGLLSQMLAGRSKEVLGIDLAEAALGLARSRATSVNNLAFSQGDITDLDPALDGRFDLVVLADTIYYLSPLTDDVLKDLSSRLAKLLAPGGVCLLANHFFFGVDRDSRISRRIHEAFSWSPGFTLVKHHRRAFFLATVLARRKEETNAVSGSPSTEGGAPLPSGVPARERNRGGPTVQRGETVTDGQSAAARLVRGSAKPRVPWAGLGWRTLEGRPFALIRRSASVQSGAAASSWVQCTTLASSHQSESFGIAFKWRPPDMNARIPSWSRQSVIVQNVSPRSGSNDPPRNPGARLHCRSERTASSPKPGMNRNALMRSRVTLTKTMSLSLLSAARLRPPGD